MASIGLLGLLRHCVFLRGYRFPFVTIIQLFIARFGRNIPEAIVIVSCTSQSFGKLLLEHAGFERALHCGFFPVGLAEEAVIVVFGHFQSHFNGIVHHNEVFTVFVIAISRFEDYIEGKISSLVTHLLQKRDVHW